mmetsp:Transcript_47194/g.48042  ORF Transcript_47194/g.48042 Transcript_47194/m.48042 type:complete len:292 (-) Transcript_47194:428-1303(-)
MNLVSLDTFNTIFDFGIEFLKFFNILVGGIPIPTSIRFQKRRDHITKGIGIGIQQALLHLGIINKGIIGIFKDKVIDFPRRGRPTHGVAQTFLDFPDSFVTRRQHAFVKFWIQEFRAGIQADCFTEGTHLCIRGRGVSHQRQRLFLIIPQSLDDLSGITIIIMGDIRNRNFRRIQVLERRIDRLESTLKEIGLLFHHAGLVGIERKAFPCQKLFLQLTFIFPPTIFNGNPDIGRITPGRIGKDTTRGFPERNLHFLGLFFGMLAHEIHVIGFIGFGGHFNASIHEIHLIDK